MLPETLPRHHCLHCFILDIIIFNTSWCRHQHYFGLAFDIFNTTLHGLSLVVVINTTLPSLHCRQVFRFPVKDRTWSLPSDRVSGEDHTWSFTSVGVRVSGEDRTWSLMPVGASIPDEDHTWSLTFTRVPFFGEDCSWSATPEPTPVFSFNSPLHHASKKAVVKGRIMSWT